MPNHTRSKENSVPRSNIGDRFWGSLVILSPLVLGPALALLLGIPSAASPPTILALAILALAWMALPVRGLVARLRAFANQQRARRATPVAPPTSSPSLSAAS